MNKSMIAGIVVGAVIATAGAAIGGYKLLEESSPTHAEVLAVEKITDTVETPREVCEEVQVTRQKQPRDDKQILGTVAGAVVGGVLGNQVGGGTGKKIATVAGAAAGGYAGKKTQERMQADDTYTTTETQCHTVYDSKDVTTGYNVTYRIGDEEGTVRMDHEPGDRIPLENGKLKIQ
ncbi:MAG: hypothetical protein CMK32_12695 [Porticoccaceae bacterium]|nr:hypothetical protein [Porticoccaceae bacterium]